MIKDWCAIHGYTEFAYILTESGMYKQACAVCNDDLVEA